MASNKSLQIRSTAGAVPIRNDKGEISMQKVKVQRYVTGKRPLYAPQSDDEEIEEEDEFIEPEDQLNDYNLDEEMARDRRMKRLMQHQQGYDAERRRNVTGPEILSYGDDEASADDEMEFEDDEPASVTRRFVDESGESDEDLDEDEIDRRRELMRQRARERLGDEKDLLELEDERRSEDAEEDESSEYEEYTDSEEEHTGPRLKPVFVRKSDRGTIKSQREMEKEEEIQAKKEEQQALARRQEAKRLVNAVVLEELKEEQKQEEVENVVNTDDDNDEEEYEGWKVRELNRIKKERDARDQREKEKEDIERIRNMNDEERRLEFLKNPKVLTNKGPKGRYKFLQKYYHKGAFFMDNQEEVYQRSYAEPTLEDHFDKTILPKVMQVKHFGRSGRTKYTHLVDQDTTDTSSAWAQESAINHKYYYYKAAGRKSLEDPSSKKKK